MLLLLQVIRDIVTQFCFVFPQAICAKCRLFFYSFRIVSLLVLFLKYRILREAILIFFCWHPYERKLEIMPVKITGLTSKILKWKLQSETLRLISRLHFFSGVLVENYFGVM